jgi:hypothetical protein
MLELRINIIDRGIAGNFIEIASLSEVFVQTMEDGRWVKSEVSKTRETEILTLGKSFSERSEAEAFTKTKQFRSLLNNLKKNWA